MVVWINLDIFAITYLIEIVHFKFHFPIEVILS